jgi:hypothetical protein
MTRRETLAAILAAGFTSSCSLIFPGSFRYRISVDVASAKGVSKAAGVLEAWIVKQPIQIGDYGAYKAGLRGEAVEISVGSRPIFALIDPELSVWIGVNFLGDLRDHSDKVADYRLLASRKMRGRTIELPREKFPRFAFFGDVADPTSAVRVDPDDLSTSVGVKGRVARMAVTLTDQAVTTGIVNSLPWLPDQKGAFLRVDFAKPRHEWPFSTQIGQHDFWKGSN